MLTRIKPAHRFSFHCYIPALPRATADYTKHHAVFALFFVAVFVVYTRFHLSLCATDSHLPWPVSPGGPS